MESLTPDQLSAYFCRVKLAGLTQPVTANLQLLCKLHLAHVQQIPYENLSLHLDRVSQGCPHHQCNPASHSDMVIVLAWILFIPAPQHRYGAWPCTGTSTIYKDIAGQRQPGQEDSAAWQGWLLLRVKPAFCCCTQSLWFPYISDVCQVKPACGRCCTVHLPASRLLVVVLVLLIPHSCHMLTVACSALPLSNNADLDL